MSMEKHVSQEGDFIGQKMYSSGNNRFMGKQHLIVSGVLEGSEGNVLVLKEEENVSDRDPNYQTTIDQDEFEMLQNLSLSQYRNTENVGVCNRDVIEEAIKYLTTAIEKKANDKFYKEYLSAKIIDLGDGNIGVEIVSTTRMNAGKGPVTAGHNHLFLYAPSVLGSFEFSDTVKKVIQNLDETESSQGNIGYTVHLTTGNS